MRRGTAPGRQRLRLSLLCVCRGVPGSGGAHKAEAGPRGRTHPFHPKIFVPVYQKIPGGARGDVGLPRSGPGPGGREPQKFPGGYKVL